MTARRSKATNGTAMLGEPSAPGTRPPPSIDDFNRRIGGVLFGEPGDHFGQAIELLAQTHRLPGMKGMMNARFWEEDVPPLQSVAKSRASAERS